MFKVLAFIACLALANATTVDRCSADVDMPTEVRVEGCDASPCIFHKGEIAIIEVDITLAEDAATLPVWAKAIILGIEIDLPLPEEDACLLLPEGQTCPLAAGDSTTIRVEIPIDDTIPTITADLQVGVNNANGTTLICFAAEVSIE